MFSVIEEVGYSDKPCNALVSIAFSQLVAMVTSISLLGPRVDLIRVVSFMRTADQSWYHVRKLAGTNLSTGRIFHST